MQMMFYKFSLQVNQFPPPKIKTLVHKIFTMAEGKPLKMQLKCPLMIVYMSAGSRVGGRSIQANLVLPQPEVASWQPRPALGRAAVRRRMMDGELDLETTHLSPDTDRVMWRVS